MKELIKELTEKERDLIINFLTENVFLNKKELNKVKKEVTILLTESYDLLDKNEKQQRLSLLQGIINRTRVLSESYNVNNKNKIELESFKEVMIKLLEHDNSSHNSLKSKYHYKVISLLNYLVPPNVRKNILESNYLEQQHKLKALEKALTELVIKIETA